MITALLQRQYFTTYTPVTTTRLRIAAVFSSHCSSSYIPHSYRYLSSASSSTPPILLNKILVANRGEIACRVIETCRKLGVQTVAVYSNGDTARAKHAQMADEAYEIGHGPEALNSYLMMDDVIDIAHMSNAQAIHPGYGFLSENAAFARKLESDNCKNNKLIFIGPSSEAIEIMGSKSRSKIVMMEAGVPVVPGYNGEDQDSALLYEEACKVGFPCLIKAVMGGGGKGMRIVLREGDFRAALESCQRESVASFGNGSVIIERYLPEPRHIEVQIFGDSHGNTVYLHERDCSVQRRHQKVLEEAPAPGLSSSIRKRIGEVAVRAAKAVNYVGAGTVEFLFDKNTDDFYFCEMNTRLQVEHPVTEMITGLDLVEWQLRIASGEVLPVVDQNNIPGPNGHAIEARIYAENPLKKFLPASGKLELLKPPSFDGIRIDSGVVEGDNVSVYYDPMISKVISHGEDRKDAIKKLIDALKTYNIAWLPTNIDFVIKCLLHPTFSQGSVTTKFLELYGDEIQRSIGKEPSDTAKVLCFCSILLKMENRVGLSDLERARTRHSPWSSLSSSWRVMGLPVERHVNFVSSNQRDDSSGEGSRYMTAICRDDGSYIITINGRKYHVSGTLTDKRQLIAIVNSRKYNVTSYSSRDHNSGWRVSLWPITNSEFGRGCIGREDEFFCSLMLPSPHMQMSQVSEKNDGSGKIRSPMPGKISKIFCKVGDDVSRGNDLLVMEAMKMEHPIRAPKDGVIKDVICRVGDVVNDDQLLVMIEVPEKD